MSHLNIAIIKKQSLDSSNEKQQFDYLVQKNVKKNISFSISKIQLLGQDLIFQSLRIRLKSILIIPAMYKLTRLKLSSKII